MYSAQTYLPTRPAGRPHLGALSIGRSSRSYDCGSSTARAVPRGPDNSLQHKTATWSRLVLELDARVCRRAERNDMEREYISSDIENVEHYLGELFQVPVGVCIA